MKYMIQEKTLTDIANAIREKLDTDTLYRPQNMPEAIRAITSEESNENYQFLGSHVDEFGIWHQPLEWDDIESLPIYDDHDVVYILYNLKDYEVPFVSVAILPYTTNTNVTYSVGRVRGGTFFEIDGSRKNILCKTITTNMYIRELFTEYKEDNDYLVLKIEANGYLRLVKPTNWLADDRMSVPYMSQYQPALMRYGTMAGGTDCGFRTYMLESDNIINFAKLHEGNTTKPTCSNAYYQNYNMQRWRCEGWNLQNTRCSSYYSMFNACYCLSDVPQETNMIGWVNEYTTTVGSMFADCWSWRNSLNVANWNFAGCTAMHSIFGNMYIIEHILGIETWSNATVAPSISGIFNNCRNLKGIIDFSNLHFTNKLTNLSNFAGNCYKLEGIKLDNANLSNVTTMSSFINGSNNIKTVSFNNCIMPTKCTNYGTVFNASGIEEVEIDGWNFTPANVNTVVSLCGSGCKSLKKVVFKNCISPVTYTAGTVNIGSMDTVLTYLDMSCLDLSAFENSNGLTLVFSGIHNLIDFYPPQNICVPFSVDASRNLSKESVLRIINNLMPTTKGYTLTLKDENIMKLTDDEIALATNKGWTLV